jgi:hypothetical protein
MLRDEFGGEYGPQLTSAMCARGDLPDTAEVERFAERAQNAF